MSRRHQFSESERVLEELEDEFGDEDERKSARNRRFEDEFGDGDERKSARRSESRGPGSLSGLVPRRIGLDGWSPSSQFSDEDESDGWLPSSQFPSSRRFNTPGVGSAAAAQFPSIDASRRVYSSRPTPPRWSSNGVVSSPSTRTWATTSSNNNNIAQIMQEQEMQSEQEKKEFLIEQEMISQIDDNLNQISERMMTAPDIEKRDVEEMDRRNTRLCREIKKGNQCRNYRCPYAHSIEELTPLPCTYNKECGTMFTTCDFIHPGETKEHFLNRLRITHKNNLCPNFPNCQYGNCVFAHSLEELQPLICYNGENCRNFHNCPLYHHNEGIVNFCRRVFGVNVPLHRM